MKPWQCTAVTEVEVSGVGPRYVLCELVAHEEQDHHHAGMLIDKDPWGAGWVRWVSSAPEGHIECREWCGVQPDIYGPACTLFRSHPSLHSWDFTDPTVEVLADEIESGWLRRPPGPDSKTP